MVCGTDTLGSQPIPVFHPEFGRFMLEATPGKPWGIDFKELLDVEPDMKLRYVRRLLALVSDERLTTTQETHRQGPHAAK
jgi:hypothetical protein